MSGNDTGANLFELKPKQTAVLLELVGGATYSEAAASSGVTKRTVVRWAQEDGAFRDALAAARKDQITVVTARMQAYAVEAVDTLRDLMVDVEAPASARVTAARNIVDYAYRAVELEEIDKRLSDLEEHLQPQ